MTDHTCTEKIGGDSIWFLWSSKSSEKSLWQQSSLFVGSEKEKNITIEWERKKIKKERETRQIEPVVVVFDHISAKSSLS